MGRLEIDWTKVFDNSSSDHEEGIYLGSPSSAVGKRARAGPSAAKRARAGPAATKRAGAEGVARASSDDEQPRGTQALHLRLEALCSELERRVGELRPGERSPVPHAAAKAAADRGQDAHPAAENVHNFNQEDGQGEHVACKYCLKSSPILVRKKNHEQADGHRKRVARAAAKNEDKEPAPPEEIFEAIREIPSLERAGLLRAYSMLIRDDCLFRSLMALPEDMRKDWLLMEIENQ